MEIGSPGATRITTKTMTATPKSVISVVTLRVRMPRRAVIGAGFPHSLSESSSGEAERRPGDPATRSLACDAELLGNVHEARAPPPMVHRHGSSGLAARARG